MDKPVPTPNAITKPYWDGCSQEQLLYQSCAACGRAQFYPRARCIHCQHHDLEWRRSSGRATVAAVTEVHAGHPEFTGSGPYKIVLVDLEEGFRMMMNVLGGAPCPIGTRGRVVFESRGRMMLPQFEPDQIG